jgi:hypothetical protein
MRTLLIALLAIGLNAACNKPAAPAVQTRLTTRQFIELFVQLRNAQGKPQSAQEHEQAKQQILRKAGVTEADLRDFVKAHAHDLTLMAGVWDSIQNRLNRPELVPQQ